MSTKPRRGGRRGPTAKWAGKSKATEFPYVLLAQTMLASEADEDRFGAMILISIRESSALVTLKKKSSDESVRAYFQKAATLMFWSQLAPDASHQIRPATITNLAVVPIVAAALSELANLRPSQVSAVGKKLKKTSAAALESAIAKAKRARDLIQKEIMDEDFRRYRALELYVEQYDSEPAVMATKHYGRDYRALFVALAAEADRMLGLRPVNLIIDIMNSPSLRDAMGAPPPRQITNQTATKILNRATQAGLLKPQSQREKSATK